jgi:hypothetical protein
LLPNTKKDIEINRLTLGFMNYDKLKDIYKDPLSQQGQGQSPRQKKQIPLLM